MQRDHTPIERELTGLRRHPGEIPLELFLDDYPGIPRHGGTRRDVERARPRPADLAEEPSER